MKLPVICNKIYLLLVLLVFTMLAGVTTAQEEVATEEVAAEEVATEEVTVEEVAAEEEMLITADLLFPKTTCAYISIRDVTVLRDSWQKTALGELQKTPEMKQFFKSLQEQLAESMDVFQNRLGVTLDDIGKIAATEIAAALMQVDAKRYGVAVIVNVGDKQYETQSVLSKIAKRVTENGGTHQKQEVEDAEIHILNVLDSETETLHKTYYVLKGELLLASDKPEVIKDILTRLTAIAQGSEVIPESFSNIDAYLDILNNTIVDETLPDIIWYVDPIRFMQVQRLMHIERDPSYARSKNRAELLSKAGIDGIAAIGGVATLSHQGYDCTQRTFVSIPEEPQGSLKMLSFDTKANQELPDWISEKVGAVHVVNLNFLDIFDNIGPLVNQFFGEGSETVWDDVLDGFENDPYGPQLNLREEIFGLLENKMIFMVQNLDAKAIDGECSLIAVPVKDEARLRENLGALLNEEPTFEVLENGDDIRWKLLDEEHNEGSAGSEVKGKRFPEMTLTVWNGHLLIASQPDFVDYIQSQEESAPLAESPLYKKLREEATALAGERSKASFHFMNNEVLREHTYEMIKSGMLAESVATHSSLLGDLIRNSQEKANAKAKIDASSLPEYEHIKAYFLPSGGCISPVEGGILYQGFWMSRKKMEK